MTDLEQLTLDFARLVAGYPDAAFFGNYLRDNSTEGIAQLLPDYPNDWNATIGAIEARGWMWSFCRGYDTRLAMIGIVKDGNGVFSDQTPLPINEPSCAALMRAAVEAAKEGK